MRESKFYGICDAVEEINENITDDYVPTVSDIDGNVAAYGIEEQVEIISYFASNPFKRQGNSLANDYEYKKTVAHCMELLNQVQLQEEI